GLDVMKTKELEGIHGPVLSISKRDGPGFEEPFDDDDAMDEEQARVNSNLESDDDGDDS
ncbi:hypothetical protein HAX54_014827, partial [Datura stramonium]|nr:hypothetical protein [Datura stramonium]